MSTLRLGINSLVVLGVSGVQRGIVIPQTTVPDPSSLAPFSDSQLAQYIPTPAAIVVPGIQHPYFKAAENLPRVDVEAFASSSR